jgi:hypothetical protein
MSLSVVLCSGLVAPTVMNQVIFFSKKKKRDQLVFFLFRARFNEFFLKEMAGALPLN